MSLVSLTPCSGYDLSEVTRALEEVLAPLGGLNWVRPGMRIVIKPNLVSRAAPEDAVTTHPSLLCALTQMLTERGAKVIIGDSPGGLFNAAALHGIYSATGMTQSEAYGASLNNNFSVKNASYPQALAAKTFQYTAYLDEADAIINLCKLKTHGMMGLSAAVKNLFGVIPGTMKLEYHYRFPERSDFVRMLFDLSDYFKPCLHLCDAIVAMEGNGPTNGTPRPMGALLASACPHSLDLLCAHLIGLTPQDVPTLAEAISQGRIPQSAEELEICGNPSDFICRTFQTIPIRKSIRFERHFPRPLQPAVALFLRSCIAPRPMVTPSSCIGCGKCASLCPAHAIRMEKKRPIIRSNICIRCFCCQEFCPVGALHSKRPLLARMLTR